MRNFVPSDPISRVRYQLRRHGVRTTIGKAAQHVRTNVYLDETHVWYELPLGTDRPRLALPPGLALVRGGADELPLLEELPNVSRIEARLRMEAGADLWLVLDEGQQLVFACWSFRGSTPVLAAPNGRLTLPPGIICFEDSATSTSYRGRGTVAPAAWSRIADRLEEAGDKSVIAKVEEGNKVARWAITRSGFREIATMHFRRVGPKRRTTVRAGTGPTAGWLAEQLQR